MEQPRMYTSTTSTMSITIWGTISSVSRLLLVQIRGTETAAYCVWDILKSIALSFMQPLRMGYFKRIMLDLGRHRQNFEKKIIKVLMVLIIEKNKTLRYTRCFGMAWNSCRHVCFGRK